MTRRGCLVSILAHPERWALQHTTMQNNDIEKFQSSPTPKGGRYAAVLELARREREFQSSPTPKGGRYVNHECLHQDHHGFNPRPPRKVGATIRLQAMPPDIRVSILAHPERWALRDGSVEPMDTSGVSILAHPERWALHDHEDRRQHRGSVSILAHPERWALRQTDQVVSLHFKFQSSPTPKGGRYVRLIKSCHSISSFNPRPPRKVGATWRQDKSIDPTMVSILAHPERWALPSATDYWEFGIWFQSSPTPKGGRYDGRVVVLITP